MPIIAFGLPHKEGFGLQTVWKGLSIIAVMCNCSPEWKRKWHMFGKFKKNSANKLCYYAGWWRNLLFWSWAPNQRLFYGTWQVDTLFLWRYNESNWADHKSTPRSIHIWLNPFVWNQADITLFMSGFFSSLTHKPIIFHFHLENHSVLISACPNSTDYRCFRCFHAQAFLTAILPDILKQAHSQQSVQMSARPNWF